MILPQSLHYANSRMGYHYPNKDRRKQWQDYDQVGGFDGIGG